jgi:hypothetical protein
MRRGYARGRERDDAIRAGLTPLGPGERPVALKVAAAVALLLALANLVAAVADTGVDGRRPALTGLVIFEVLMVVAAVGLWRRQYWAVLGFEVILGITIAIAAVSLMVAANVLAVVVCVAVVGLGGWLFWKLVRVMGRLQVPGRGARTEVR